MAEYMTRITMRATYCAIAAALLIGSAVLPADWLGVMIVSIMFMTLALGLQILAGNCQLLDLGYAGFVGLGAYTTAILMKAAQWSYWTAAVAAMGLCCAGGIAVGIPTLRLRGDYFAIVTFGFSELVVLLIRNWPALTGGAIGLGDIPNPVICGYDFGRYPPTSYWFLALAILAVVVSCSLLLGRTSLGRQMVAVGDDDVLAESVGIDVTAVRVSAFAISALVAGLVGSFWAVYFKYLAFPEFSLNLSIQVLAIVVLASSRKVYHVVVAAAVLAPLGELLRRGLRFGGLPDGSRFIMYGIALVLIVVIRAKLRRNGTL